MMPGDPVHWQLPSRKTRFLPTLIAVGVIAVIAFVGLRGKPSDPIATNGPLPPSPVVGVVVAVDSPSLGVVNAFALTTADGSAFDFEMGQLENATEFSPSHLSEHMATSEPIRVFYRLVSGNPVVYRLEDAAAPSASVAAGVDLPTAAVSSTPPEVTPPEATPPGRTPELISGACVSRDPSATETKPFDGSCYGWRIAPYDVMLAEGLDRNLTLDCEPQLYGNSIETSGPPIAGHPTDIDLEFAALPAGSTLEHIDRWACGSMGLSDHAVLSFDAEHLGGTIDVDRALMGAASIEIDVPSGSVTACRVRGLPAICIDSTTAYSMIEVIEDGTFDPHAVVLRVYSGDMPFEALLAVVESVVRK